MGVAARSGPVLAPKKPFAIAVALRRIRRAIRPYAPAMLFELAEGGFRSAFEQTVACLISIRTRDEVSLPAARRLFALARTPAELSRLPVETIARCLRPATFYPAKARQLRALAADIVDRFGGVLPCRREAILSLNGIGPKCAGLVTGIACREPAIGVDIHVHRITNRWGYVHTRTPEATLRELEKKLPRRYWVEINRLLVPFGKHLCTGVLPRCSSCPVEEMCRQVGVTGHR